MFYAPRPFMWFVLFAIIACSSLYFAHSSLLNQRHVSLLVVVTLAVMQSLIPMVQNRGIIFGPDQWRDLKVTTFIADQGNFENAPYLPNDYYSVIPLFNVLNTVVSKLLGWEVMATFTLLSPILELLGVLSIYLAIRSLTKNPLLSLMTVILLISIPRGSSAQAIPSTLSSSLGALLIWLFVKAQNGASRRLLLLVSLVVLVASIVHPIGVIAILTLSFGILVVNKLFSKKKLPESQVSQISHSFIICFLIPMTCWTTNEIVFYGVFGQLTRFFHTLMTPRPMPSVYSLQYQAQGFEIYSFVWALPVATSAAYLLLSLRRVRKGKTQLDRDFSHFFQFAAALMGLGLVLAGFVSVTLNPGASVERYVNGPAYLLLALPSSLVFCQLLRVNRRIFSVFIIMVLLATVAIGSSSPDNAPFEHPTFGAIRITWTSTIEADMIVFFLPNNTHIYGDHDISVSAQAGLTNRQFTTDISFQTTRNVIESFKDNSFTTFDRKYIKAIIVIKADEIINQELFNSYVNVIYNSQRHVTIILPQNPEIDR